MDKNVCYVVPMVFPMVPIVWYSYEHAEPSQIVPELVCITDHVQQKQYYVIPVISNLRLGLKKV